MTNQQVFDQLDSLQGSFTSDRLNRKYNELLVELRVHFVDHLPDYTIDDVAEHTRISLYNNSGDGSPDYSYTVNAVGAIKQYREKHKAGLLEAKLKFDDFIAQNRDAVKARAFELLGHHPDIEI